MVESYRVDNQGYKIDLSVIDEELSFLAKKVGGKLVAGEKDYGVIVRKKRDIAQQDIQSA